MKPVQSKSFAADDQDLAALVLDADPEPADVRNALARAAVAAYRAAAKVHRAAYEAFNQTEDLDEDGEIHAEWEEWLRLADVELTEAADRLCRLIGLWCGRLSNADGYDWPLRGWEPCIAEIDGTHFVVAPESDEDTSPRLTECSASGSYVSSRDGD
jgi:hypothetical protein